MFVNHGVKWLWLEEQYQCTGVHGLSMYIVLRLYLCVYCMYIVIIFTKKCKKSYQFS